MQSSSFQMFTICNMQSVAKTKIAIDCNTIPTYNKIKMRVVLDFSIFAFGLFFGCID